MDASVRTTAPPSDGSSLRFLAAPKKPIILPDWCPEPYALAGLYYGNGLGSSASRSREDQTSSDVESRPFRGTNHFEPTNLATQSCPMFSVPSRDITCPDDESRDIGLHPVPEVAAGLFTFSPPRDTDEGPVETFFEDDMWALGYRDFESESSSEGDREENPVVIDDDSDHDTGA